MRYISLILLLILTAAAARAQTYSYVYIQGDKQTPFYVKLEGEMLPRYGKNYCIIPRLEAGVINVDILFQQNAYPAQHFVIKVPENGSRGFYLTRKNDAFSLFDLQQQFYLPAGNSANDDHAPDKNAVTSTPPVVTATPEAVTATPVKTATREPEQTTDTVVAVVKETVKTTVPAPVTIPAATPGQPKFIEDIQLDNDHTVKPVNTDSLNRAIQQEATRKADSVLAAMKQEKEKAAAPPDTITAPPAQDTAAQVKTSGITAPQAADTEIPNSDCPAPLGDEQFEIIYKKALQQTDEESRLSYIDEQMGNCYSTAQAGILAKSMDSDAARYTFLKKVYPRITDQSKFVSLQDLLSTAQWRGHFMEIVKH